MKVSKSPFGNCNSKQILAFAYLICPSVSRLRELKIGAQVPFAIFNSSEKLLFFKKDYKSDPGKITLGEKIFANKILQTCFTVVVYMLS